MEPLSLNLGPRGKDREGTARRKAYEEAQKRDGAKSLNEWCKIVLDRAAGFEWEEEKGKKEPEG